MHFAQKVRTVSTVGKQGNGKVGVSFKDGGITDLRPGQTLPRASNKVTVPRTTWKNNRDRTTTTNQSDLTKRIARLKDNDAKFTRAAPKPKQQRGTKNPYDRGEGPSKDKGSGGPSDARKYNSK